MDLSMYNVYRFVYYFAPSNYTYSDKKATAICYNKFMKIFLQK